MNLKAVYTHGYAIAAQVVGYVVAFVPGLASHEQYLVAGGGVVLSAAILLADAVKNRPAGESALTAVKVTADDVRPVVQSEIAKLLGAAAATQGATTATPTPIAGTASTAS